LNAKT